VSLWNGTLDGVTWQGVLQVADRWDCLTVEGGLTLQGVGGVGPGSSHLSGASYFGIVVSGSETLDNATLNFGDEWGRVGYR
jgi:hypothetical protein